MDASSKSYMQSEIGVFSLGNKIAIFAPSAWDGCFISDLMIAGPGQVFRGLDLHQLAII